MSRIPARHRASLSEKLYRALLLAYSPAFRAESGSDMIEVFRDAHRTARQTRGRAGVASLWIVTLLDLGASAVTDRLSTLTRRGSMRTDIRHTPPHRGKGNRMDDFAQDLRYAVRNLLRRPAFTGVVVLTLALGIGANTAVFSLINEVLLRPVPIVEPERVTAIFTSGSSGGGFGSSSYPDYVDFRENNTAFADMAAYYQAGPMNMATDEAADQVTATLASGNYFNLVGVRPTIGRLIQSEDDVTPGAHAVAVLSHAFWQRRFGGRESVVGESITLNAMPFTIIGVAAEGFHGTTLFAQADIWLPLKMVGATNPIFTRFPVFEMRAARWLFVVGRLDPGSTIPQAMTELNTIMARLADEYPQSNMGTVVAPNEPRPIQVLSTTDAAVGGGNMTATVKRARLLLITVSLVLLIACANVANMLLARARGRRREMALRLALGARRSRLIRQLLTESSVLAITGGGLGLVLAWWLGNVLIPFGLPSAISQVITVPELTMDWRVMSFALVLSIGTGVLFGLAPALRTSGTDLVAALKDTDLPVASSRRRYGLRDVLVVVQIASSLMLLIGAGLFVRSLQEAYSTQLGFNPDRVLLTSLNVARQGLDSAQAQEFYRSTLARVSALPGVEATSLAAFYPVQSAGARTNMLPEGYQAEDGEDMELSYNVVTPGYFETVQTTLVQGQVFSDRHDASAPAVLIVNQTFAERYWPGENAVGKRVQLPTQDGPIWAEVIGVAQAGKYRDIRESPRPYVYFPLEQQSLLPPMTLGVRTAGDPIAAIPGIRAAIRALDPTLPLNDVRSLNQHLGNHLTQDRTTALLVGVLGLLALMVAGVGVFGVMSYAVAQRTQEIGIRSALGARSGDVLHLVVGRGMRLAFVGVAIGAAGALGLTRLIAGFLFGVSPTDPFTFIGVTVVLAIVSALASYIPARRAAKVDPMLALRYE